jgi:uncharacterized protein YoaH (UPF0181 family)
MLVHEITLTRFVAAGIPLPFGHKEQAVANAIRNDHETTKQQNKNFEHFRHCSSHRGKPTEEEQIEPDFRSCFL